MFLILLKNITTHDLDENGLSVNPELVIDKGTSILVITIIAIVIIIIIIIGRHSMKFMQKSLMNKMGMSAYYGPSINDRLFVEKIDYINWAGPVRWFQGTLKIVHRSEEFKAFREIMYYHRADDFRISPLKKINRKEIVEDMIEYGYLLPFFIPLLSRYICAKTTTTNYASNFISEANNYRPYSSKCFND